jgi:hypothetical protein
LGDLPVVLFCRSPANEISLAREATQLAMATLNRFD